MQKTILITGATDGIGLEAAKILAEAGHNLLVHGRNASKLEQVSGTLSDLGTGQVESYIADLSRLDEVASMAQGISDQHDKLDVIINNAGVFKTSQPIAENGMDVRFVVNTHAPYLLAQRLMPLMDNTGRIVNLSSAAQAPVDLNALTGQGQAGDDFNAYAQSKLAITAWSKHMADSLDNGPVVVAVNPGSLLATKMVKEGFGMPGKDIGIGSDILVRAALSDEFADASGKYYDNDSQRFAPPHADAMDAQKNARIVDGIESVLGSYTI